MIIGIPKETYPGETRVALVPELVKKLQKKELSVRMETGAGVDAGFPDEAYSEKGAEIVQSRKEVFESDIVLQVRTLGTNDDQGKPDLELMKQGQVIIGMSDPLVSTGAMKSLAEKGVTSFALELVPRITRAQSMDVLSSMATVAGYKAVLWSAEHLPKFFPMFMTAAGTISPSKVFVIGAGVAGLQAIASAKRLGAVVSAYDVRPVVKEQVESLGGSFVEMELETETSQDSGGYAKAMGEDFYKKQRELMTKVVADNDVVITTAAVPGKKAPVLITAEMVKGMAPGSVIVDIAAETGGNCELTKAGEIVEQHGVTIVGPVNIPASVPYHASQMYARNITTFLFNMFDSEGKFGINVDDEIVKDSMITQDGKIVNTRVLEAMENQK